MAKRNIVLLQTDQHRHDCLGLFNPAVKTPHLDALFGPGVSFREAVCTVPMCVPSRYSMMTGLYASQHGVRHNCQMIPTDGQMPLPTLAQRLADEGYQTIGIGKTHWYTVPFLMKDMEKFDPTTRGFSIRYGQYEEGSANHEQGMITMHKDAPQAMAAWNEERSRICQNLDEGILGYQGATSSMEESNQRESWLTDKAIATLNNQLDPSRPFFLYLSLDHPHAFFNPPERFEQLYELESIPEFDSPPPGVDLAHHFPNIDHTQKWVEVWKGLEPLERKRVIRRYFALISFVDECFGRLISELKRLQLFDNTVFMFTSDHGDSMGERERFSKYSLYEGSIRVPLMIAGPAVPQELAHSVQSTPAELVDVVPTLLDVADIAIPPTLPGKSLLRPSFTKGSFAEMHGHAFDYDFQTIAPAYMWRTHEWKFILYLPGTIGDYEQMPLNSRGELYHLRTDPQEYHNLYAHPDYAMVRERLKTELLEHLMMSWAKFPFATSAGVLRKPQGQSQLSSLYRTHTVL
jgi:arylsulfatase A-like enzyme